MEASSHGISVEVPKPVKLLDQVRAAIRVRHYSIRTEHAYVDWARRYILFHGKRHPADMGAEHVQAFLSHLAVERGVSVSTQNEAKAYRRLSVVDLRLPVQDEGLEQREFFYKNGTIKKRMTFRVTRFLYPAG
jgi:hypothetical protein